jgi:hypothetical protein
VNTTTYRPGAIVAGVGRIEAELNNGALVVTQLGARGAASGPRIVTSPRRVAAAILASVASPEAVRRLSMVPPQHVEDGTDE